MTPNPWVTGGPPGGKDAVLVFRTSALSPVNSSADVSESGNTSSGVSVASDDTTTIAAASSSTLNSTKDPTGNPSNKLANHSKVLASLPKNFNVQRKSTSISSATSNDDEEEDGEDDEDEDDDDDEDDDEAEGEAEGDEDDDNDETATSQDEAGPSVPTGSDNKPKKRQLESSSSSSSLSNASVTGREGDEIEPDMPSSKSEPLLAVVDKKLTRKSQENKENQSVIKTEMPAAQLNIFYKFINTETRLLRKILNAHGMGESGSDSNDFNLLWTGIHLKPDILRNLAPYQRVNHFPR